MNGSIRRRLAMLCFAVALAAFAAPAASADPLVITSGSLAGCPSCVDESHSGNFSGGGFTFTGHAETFRAQPFANPGGTVSGSSMVSFSGGFAGLYNVAGPGGATYFVSRDSSLRFTTESFVLPAGPALSLTLTVPFTMTGTLRLTDDIARLNPPVFSFEVSGQGLAHIVLAGDGFGVYRVAEIRYDFAPAAVPEPATLTLLGAGLAATLLRRRRRGRNADRGTLT